MHMNIMDGMTLWTWTGYDTFSWNLVEQVSLDFFGYERCAFVFADRHLGESRVMRDLTRLFLDKLNCSSTLSPYMKFHIDNLPVGVLSSYLVRSAPKQATQTHQIIFPYDRIYPGNPRDFSVPTWPTQPFIPQSSSRTCVTSSVR